MCACRDTNDVVQRIADIDDWCDASPLDSRSFQVPLCGIMGIIQEDRGKEWKGEIREPLSVGEHGR